MSRVDAPPRPPRARPTAPAGPPVRRLRVRRLGDPRRRLRVALVVLAFVLSLFFGRLLQLQGVDASVYATRAEQERLVSQVVPAARGAILDRNRVALAATVDARNVTADPTLVKDPAATAAALAPVLGVDAATLTRELSRKDTRFVYLAKEVSPQTWDAVRKLDLAGIFDEPVSKRVYPNGSLAANVVGFLGADGKPLGGLEYALDQRLRGTNGRETFEAALGKQIPGATNRLQPPVPGSDVVLTIDRDIQWAAQQAIAAKVAEAGAASGTVVVLDPKTGEVLAMATAPTFDPSRPGRAPAADRGNRVVSEVYEPGSTGKLVTAAALVDAGKITPQTPITVPPQLPRAGTVFNDSEPHGVLKLTFTGVLAKSSNMGTILASERLSSQQLYDYFRRFGLGQPTGLGFPGESPGLLPPPSQWSGTQRYTLAFGQGYSVNTLQSADTFATIANAGVRVTPTLVEGYVDPGGRFQPAPAPARTQVVSAQAAQTVAQMLETVTQPGGTASNVTIPGYRIAGKTGTANRVDAACGCYRGYTSSFIGFAPADNPALVVAVVLQDPQRGKYGSQLAGPVFRDVMSFALQSRKVPPTGAPPPALPLTAP